MNRHQKKKYRIALDGRPFSSRVSGVARVISSIIAEFPEPESFEFVICTHKPVHPDFYYLKNYPNVSFVTGTGITARLGGIWFNFTLPRIIRSLKFDLFWGSQQVIPPFLPARLPVVLTYYDLVLYLFPQSMRFAARLQQLAVQKMSVKRADRILTISEQTRKDLIKKFGYPEEKTEAALLGYTPLSSQPLPGSGSGQKEKKGTAGGSKGNLRSRKVQERLLSPLSFDGPFILSVSTIEPRKNYPVLLEAYMNYLEKAQAAGEKIYPLVIAGKRGWESPEFLKKLDDLSHSTGFIHIMDNLSDTELAALYRDAAFFCLPSLYEGFGLTLLEALAEGKYALVSDIGPFHEIGGDLICYLNPQDPEAWAEAISDTVHMHRSKKLKKINFPVQQWTWASTAEKHHRAFRMFLPGKG